MLKKDNSKHGNLTLNSIFYAESRYKTYHPDVLKPSTGDNLTKFLNKQKHYSAPEVLKPYIKNSGQPKPKGQQGQGSILADIYSMGLLLLELCSLKPEKDFYKEDSMVNKDLIQSKLTEMSSNYSNEFMEMVIRMLTIDPNNRITAEELIELTSLKTYPADSNVITPRQHFNEQSQIRTDNPGVAISSGISAHNIQFKQPISSGDDSWGSSAIRRQNIPNNEGFHQQPGLQRTASGRNLFDPEILSRVNPQRAGSRIQERAREVSPAPPLPPQVPGNQTQRARLEGSGISTSRIRRGDPSKSPLRKVYGSNLESDGQVTDKPAQTQSMHNINTSKGGNPRDPALDSVSVNLNSMFNHHQSERQVPHQVHQFGHQMPTNGFNSQQQGFSSNYSQGMSPLKLNYPLSSNQNGFVTTNLHVHPPVVDHQPTFQNYQQVIHPIQHPVRQEVVRREVSPIPTPRRDQGPIIITGTNVSPISGRYAKVTRYSVDKNGQRSLIEGGTDIRISNSTQIGSVQNTLQSKHESDSNILRRNYGDNPSFGQVLTLNNHPAPLVFTGHPTHSQGFQEHISPRPYNPVIVSEAPRNVSPAPIAIRS